MTLINKEALRQLQRSQCLKTQRGNDNRDDDATSAEDDSFTRIQHLDTLLHASVANGNYDMALQYAKDMQSERFSYYGYQRAAQIYLIQNKYFEAYNEYAEGKSTLRRRPGEEMLEKSIHDNIHIFDQEASGLAKMGKFDEAHRIAVHMIHLLPLFPIGYLRAGAIYEMRGNSKKAMEYYKEPLSSDRYDKSLLIQRISDLQQRINRMQRYDFISQLPTELVSDILRHIDTSSLVKIMNVSNGWKKRILRCPEAWRVITVNHPGEHMNVAAFQEVKTFVQKVTIKKGTTNRPFLQDLLASIGDGEFPNIVSFELAPDTMETQYMPHITRILSSVKLTDLDLEADEVQSYIPLHQVLEHCSHLKRLRYHTDGFPLEIAYGRLPQEPTMITYLSIGGYSSDIDEKIEDSSFFAPLIHLFPHLIYLRITDYETGDLQTIMDKCTHLRWLIVSYDPTESFPAVADPDYTLEGLQHLKIEGVFDPEDVADVIHKCSKTLKTLYVRLRQELERGDVVIDTEWNWEDIPSLNCPLLEDLDFEIDYYWPFDQWIGECPVLTNINVDCEGYDPRDDPSFRRIVNYDPRTHGSRWYVTADDSDYEDIIDQQW